MEISKNNCQIFKLPEISKKGLTMKQKSEFAMSSFAVEAESILETAKAIDPEQLAKAAEVLSKAPRIAATGCGHSGIVARRQD